MIKSQVSQLTCTYCCLICCSLILTVSSTLVSSASFLVNCCCNSAFSVTRSSISCTRFYTKYEKVRVQEGEVSAVPCMYAVYLIPHLVPGLVLKSSYQFNSVPLTLLISNTSSGLFQQIQYVTNIWPLGRNIV